MDESIESFLWASAIGGAIGVLISVLSVIIYWKISVKIQERKFRKSQKNFQHLYQDAKKI